MRNTATNAINKAKIQITNNGSDELKINFFFTIFFTSKLLSYRHQNSWRFWRLDIIIKSIFFQRQRKPKICGQLAVLKNLKFLARLKQTELRLNYS